jgi:hypothetical protein
MTAVVRPDKEHFMTTPMFNFSPRFPWSGDVIQDIDPQTSWFFGNIAPSAGSGRLERHIALDVASYGKQLSVVIDVLHELIENGRVTNETREKFERRRTQIEQAKQAHANNVEAEAEASLKRLQHADAAAYERLLKRLARRAG